MLRSAWIAISAIIGLAFALANAANAQPVDRNASHYGPAHERQANPPPDSAEPAPPPTIQGILQRIARTLEVANNKPEPPEGRDRAQRDLTAQEDMARWARFMLYVGGTETFVTFLGVLLVGATLIYTRNAVEAARDQVAEAAKATNAAVDAAAAAVRQAEIAQRQFEMSERPWLSVNIELKKATVKNVRSFEAEIDFLVKNHGKTVATNVFFEVAIFPTDRDVLDKFKVIQQKASENELAFKAEPDHKNFGRVVFPDQEITMQIQLRNDPAAGSMIWPTIVGLVPYDSPLDEKVHHTGFVFYLSKRDPKRSTLVHAFDSTDIGDVAVADVDIRAGFVTGVID
jgi:hypothetical protein